MKSTPSRDKIFALLSWGIVFMMLYAAVQVSLTSSAGTGPVASAIGITAMKVFYASVYSGQALLLAYSKAFKKKQLRKGILMSIYLFMGFTTLLVIAGPTSMSLLFLDNAVITVVAALCWLHWKFRTEYLNPDEFNEFIALENEE